MNEEEARLPLSLNPDILCALKTNRITKISRASDKYSLKDCLENASEKIAFDFLPGAILFHLESGDVIGFSREAVFNSVVCWFQLQDGKEDRTYYYVRELSDHIFHDDPTYSSPSEWSHMIGTPVKSIKALIFPLIDKPGYQAFNQRAIIFETERGDMVISYCLLDLTEGPPFPITRKSKIPEDMWREAKVIEL